MTEISARNLGDFQQNKKDDNSASSSGTQESHSSQNQVDDLHFPLTLKPNGSMRNSMLFQNNSHYVKFAQKNN